jgi:hypothetical protein
VYIVLICRWPNASYNVASIVEGVTPNREAVSRSITMDSALPPNCWSVTTSASSGSFFNFATSVFASASSSVWLGSSSVY